MGCMKGRTEFLLLEQWRRDLSALTPQQSRYIRSVRSKVCIAVVQSPSPMPDYCCGFVSSGCCGGLVVAPGGLAVSAGFFAGAFFFATGFFGGSVSSTTTFFGGAASTSACRVFNWPRSCASSCSFDEDRFSIRSASCFRDASNAFRSLDSDCESSFEPNAPAPSTTSRITL